MTRLAAISDQVLNKSHPLNQGLVVCCLPGLGGRSGYTLRDISGRYNNGTLTNAPAWVGSNGMPGAFGGIQMVRASTTTIPYTLKSNRILANNAFTISVRFFNDIAPDGSANTDRNIWQTSNLANSCLLMHHDRAGFGPTTSFAVRSGFGGPIVSFTSTTLQAFTPYHLVGVYKSGDQRLYLDGILRASSTTTFTLPSDFGDMTLGSGWDGAICSVRLYDRALTDGECFQLSLLERQGSPGLLNRTRRTQLFVGAGGGGTVSPNLLHSNLLQSHLLTGLAR